MKGISLGIIIFIGLNVAEAQVQVNLSEDQAPIPTVSSTVTQTIPSTVSTTPSFVSNTATTSTTVTQQTGCAYPVTITSEMADFCSPQMAQNNLCVGNNGTVPVFSGAASQLSCLQNIVDGCIAGGVVTSSATVANMLAWECSTASGCEPFPPGQQNQTDYERFIWAQMDDCVAQAIGGAAALTAGSMTVNLDEGCQTVAPDAAAGMCVADAIGVHVLPSPISLVWNDGADLNENNRVVRFPLDPAVPDAFYVWKASADHPLLVHDPAHSGTITTAAQLFGNFTFGKSWKNGYQALASLDANSDGKLSGAELEPLALWFDNDRDAVSAAGEVQTLTAAGVEEIYYVPSSTTGPEGDLLASRGYAAKVSGRSHVRASIDWYSKAYDSEMAAVASAQERAKRSAPRSKNSSGKTTRTASESTALAGLNGAWLWSAGAPTELSPKGLLTFKEKGGQISGHSLMEIPLKRNSGKLRSRVIAFPLDGTLTKAPDGSTRIEFTMSSAEGLPTASRAILSADGRTLEGISSSHFDKEPGNGSSLTYNWTARRAR